jgi:hypothetical protein
MSRNKIKHLVEGPLIYPEPQGIRLLKRCR